jgi:hypothetical protein
MLIKNAPHQEYRIKNGTLVPGVTTVLGIMNKPALGKWMWQCGKDGVPWPIPKEATAGVGTIAHYKIHCFLSDEKEEYGTGWEEEHIKTAQIPFEKFYDYYSSRGGVAILSEYSMVHETHGYGGTMDLLVETREGIELWDIKTSKAIYEENYIQLAAYKMLLDQDSKYRHMKIKPLVVLCTKDGQLAAPSVSKAYITKARNTWSYLIKTYHKLQEFRKAA